MINTDENVARRIIDALALALDGKVSSAKPFAPGPYVDLSEFGNWGQDHNDSKNDTTRTRALFLAYLIFSGGRIPLRGLEMTGVWMRPDLWVAGALVKKGYLQVLDVEGVFEVTPAGWAFVADSLERLSNAG